MSIVWVLHSASEVQRHLVVGLASIALVVAVAATLIPLQFFNPPLHIGLHRLSGVEQQFAPGEAERLMRELWRYLCSDGEGLIQQPGFSNPERHHFLEVRERLRQLGIIAVAGWGALVLLLGYARLALHAALYPIGSRVMQHSGWILMGVGLVVAATWLLAFQEFFIFFHRQFFVHFDWVFTAQSYSARLFPPAYFVLQGGLFSVLLFGLGALLRLVGGRLARFGSLRTDSGEVEPRMK